MATFLQHRVIPLLITGLFMALAAKGTSEPDSTRKSPDAVNQGLNLPGSATLVANSGSPLCQATPVQYWVYIAGCNGPYTINMWLNGNLVDITTMDNPYTFSINVTSSTTVILNSVTGPGCGNITITQPNIITIAVTPPIVATLTANTKICQGGNGANLSVGFTGVGPFTFTYRVNNLIQPAITTNNNPYILHVNPSVTTTYLLNDVTGPVCSGTVSLQPVTVTVVSPPAATLAGDMTFCGLADTTLTVDFTGTGPYQFVYAIDNIAQPPIQTSSDPYLLPIHTDTSAHFTLVGVQNAVCSGAISGDADITILTTPADTNLTIHCNPVDNSYTVEFDLTNAFLPITVTSGTGTLNGMHFTSAPIHQSLDYQFVLHDSVFCKSITIAGPTVCFCVTNADSMLVADTLSACIGDTIEAIYTGPPALDGDDSLRFILHSTAGLPLGQILGWSNEPVFGFLPGMHPDTVYYISAIAGDYVGNDSIDLADICLSVSPGTPIVFHAIPTALLGNDLTICSGSPAILPIALTGAPPFSLQYAIDGLAQPVMQNISSNPFDLVLYLTDTTRISLIGVSDQYCSGAAFDTLLVTVNDVPRIVGLAYTCDPITTTYAFMFDIQGGLSPWVLAGNTGTLSGNTFTSDPVPSGQTFALTLSDNNQCGVSQVTDLITCPCYTDAGTLDPTLLKLCTGEVAHAQHNGAQALDNTDTLIFVLQDTPGAIPGNILATSNTPDFAFDPATMQYGVTYYITAIAGNMAPGGAVDTHDPCLSIAAGTPVVWNAMPTATLVGNFDVCPGQAQALEIQFTGQAPFSFEYLDNGTSNTLQTTSTTYALNTALTQSATFIPVSVTDGNCPGIVTGQATIAVHPIPDILHVIQVCDPDNLHYTVSFEVDNADWSTLVVNSTLTGLFDPATGRFTSSNANLPDLHTFYVSDGWACGQDTLEVAPNCPCLTDAGVLNTGWLKLCPGEVTNPAILQPASLDNNDVLIFVLHTSPGPGLGAILANSNNPGFNFDPAVMQYGVTYYIAAVAGNPLPGGGIDLSDPCLSISAGTPVVWNNAPTAAISGDADICPGQPLALSISFTGAAPFSLDYLENGTPKQLSASANTYALSTTLTQSGSFTPVAIHDANCIGTVSGQANITVHPIPEVANPVQVCNPDNLHYSVSFDVLHADLGTLSIQSGLSGIFDATTGHFSSAAGDLPNGYTFLVSDAWQCGTDTLVITPDCACITNAGIISQTPLHVCWGADIEFPAAAGQVLDGFDVAQYVLCTDPNTLPQSILARSGTPQFAFSPSWQPGANYFVLVVAGNPLPGGEPDMQDPCFSQFGALPVTIHALPTASISGDTTLCIDTDFDIPIDFTGTAPFTCIYTLNGLPQNTIVSNQNSYPIQVENIQQQQIFQLQTIQDQYCTGVASGMSTLNIQQLPTVTLSGSDSICPGGNALLHVGLQYATSCDFTLVGTTGSSKQIIGAGNGSSIPVTPTQTTIYSMHNVQVFDNGCPPIASGTGKVDLAPLTVTASASTYNGFGISCFGAQDGIVIASRQGGFDPVQLLWSTTATETSITDLPAGVYDVVVTDAEGCTDVASVEITEPEPLEIAWAAIDLDCHQGSTGGIQLNTVFQGVAPYRLQINNQPEIPIGALPQTYFGLSAGLVEVSIVDANGCLSATSDTILLPKALSLDLGPDQTIFLGDSILLSGTVAGNSPVSWHWTPGTGLITPFQPTTWAHPEQNIHYTLTVEDAAGCVATDEISIRVKNGKRIYIPNVIKPNAIGDNRIFTVYGGPEVKQINFMSIYDRWGEHLFQARGILPDNPAAGWDGTWRGQEVPPAVYVYVVEIAFLDGTVELYKGSVTVVR